LTAIYWALAYPRRYGLALAWSAGLVLDVLKGGVLGQHALAMTVAVWLALRFHLRLRIFPIWQQTVAVGALIAVHQFLVFWVDGVTGEAELAGPGLRRPSPRCFAGPGRRAVRPAARPSRDALMYADRLQGPLAGTAHVRGSYAGGSDHHRIAGQPGRVSAGRPAGGQLRALQPAFAGQSRAPRARAPGARVAVRPSMARLLAENRPFTSSS
jgi:hypothetical protein